MFNLERASTHGHTKAIKEGGYISGDGYESGPNASIPRTRGSTLVPIPEGLTVLTGEKASITKIHKKPIDNRKLTKSISKAK